MIRFRNNDLPASRVEHEGLTRLLQSKPPRPTPIPKLELSRLTSTQRTHDNNARLDFISEGLLVNTAELASAKKAVRQLLTYNSSRTSGCNGLMVSGDSTLGKTTLTTTMMRYVFTQYSKQYPDFANYGRIPVVSVEVPAGCTGKLLMKAFAEFFGLTVARADTMDTIQQRVVGALNSARTQLVVVDELHNLNAGNRGNGEAVDVLKILHNRVPATFIYAGIDLTHGSLLSGARGQQLSGRFQLLELTRFNLSDQTRAKEWRSIIKDFETKLPLADHEPGSLVAHSTRLFERTQGSIGSLGQLITGAAIDLIAQPDGRPETVTIEMLDMGHTDLAAVQRHQASAKFSNRAVKASAAA